MKFLGYLVVLAVLLFVGAALQSYARLEYGHTFVDDAVRKMTGKEDMIDKAREGVDDALDKAREVIEDSKDSKD